MTDRIMLWTDSLGATPFANPIAIVILAFALDMALGDPQWLYRALPHPVALFGKAITALETRLNQMELPTRARFKRGLLVTVGLVLVSFGLAALITWGLRQWEHGWFLEGLLASTLLAYQGLISAVRAVAQGLEESLEAGRQAVAKIVGRDPKSLDEAGVTRAANESLAENFSDGVVAPLFWFVLAGLPGLVAYKMINTLDSMIGYHSDRYEDFGKAAAKLDDAVNWLPARLTGLLFVLAAALHRKGNAVLAWRTMCRDAPKHRSPNAGWQEAALAGALGFALAGPRQYAEEAVDDHWMGDGRSDLTAEDLHDAIHLARLAAALTLALLLCLWTFLP